MAALADPIRARALLVLDAHELTVTDAHVWLGRLPFDAFLDGTKPLDREAIEAPLARLASALS